MPKEFAEWLTEELAERGLSQRKLALRAGVTGPTVGQIVRGKVQPTVESIVKIAEGLEEDPISVLRLAGILPDLLPETTEEQGVVRILRALPHHLRQVAVWMVRGIHAEYQRGAPRAFQEGARVRVVLMQEGTVLGEAEKPDQYVVCVNGSPRAFHGDELLEVASGQPIAD